MSRRAGIELGALAVVRGGLALWTEVVFAPRGAAAVLARFSGRAPFC